MGGEDWDITMRGETETPYKSRTGRYSGYVKIKIEAIIFSLKKKRFRVLPLFAL
jgi:hypothetical protein